MRREIFVISRYDPEFDKRFIELFEKMGARTEYVSLHDIRLKNLRTYIEKLFVLRSVPENARIVIISRVDRHLPVILSSIAKVKPVFLLLIIPPDPHHNISSKNIALLSAVNLALSRLRARGTYIMIGYTTPRERLLFGFIFDKFDYIYLPIYSWEKEKFIGEIPVDPPKILIMSKKIEYKTIKRLIELLREVEITPLIVIGLTKENKENCNIDPRVVCVMSDTLESIIPRVTAVVVTDIDHTSTSIVARAIGSRRPIITSKEQGLAWIYEDTGLIVYSPSNDPETIASKILDILNNIDRFKQASLRIEISPPKPDKIIEYLLGIIDNL